VGGFKRVHKRRQLVVVFDRADLLRRLGRGQESRAAYDKAIDLVGNTAETAYLTRRRDQLRQRPTDPIETPRAAAADRGAPCRCIPQPVAPATGLASFE
jgi:hypothetical protein